MSEIKLVDAFDRLQRFEQTNLGQQIASIEMQLRARGKVACEELCESEAITPALLDSALLVKRLAGQINVTVHAVGILLALPHILSEGEVIEKLSLGAGNTGKDFDLETNRRIAEFKFVHWRGGPESIRQKQLFKDFYYLAEEETGRERYLYVTNEKYPKKFLQSRTSLDGVMSRNIPLMRDFRQRYPHRFTTVGEYYDYRRERVKLLDLSRILPQLAQEFDSIAQGMQQREYL
jgi:hypothetical protein